MPHPEVLARAQAAAASVWWTGRDGALLVALGQPLHVWGWASCRALPASAPSLVAERPGWHAPCVFPLGLRTSLRRCRPRVARARAGRLHAGARRAAGLSDLERRGHQHDDDRELPHARSLRGHPRVLRHPTAAWRARALCVACARLRAPHRGRRPHGARGPAHAAPAGGDPLVRRRRSHLGLQRRALLPHAAGRRLARELRRGRRHVDRLASTPDLVAGGAHRSELRVARWRPRVLPGPARGLCALAAVVRGLGSDHARARRAADSAGRGDRQSRPSGRPRQRPGGGWRPSSRASSSRIRADAAISCAASGPGWRSSCSIPATWRRSTERSAIGWRRSCAPRRTGRCGSRSTTSHCSRRTNPSSIAVGAGRANWLPLFDAFRLTAAFENHGHLHKRTLPLRAGAPVADGTGTVFFGDGCWGKSHLKSSIPERGYLAASLPRRHFWKVTVSEQGARYQAIDGFGRVFDSAAQDASGAWIRE